MKRNTFFIVGIITFWGCISNNSPQTDSVHKEQEELMDDMKGSTQILPEYDYRDIDTKELAQLLVEAQNTGELNDTAFANYFHSCGMEYGELPVEYGLEEFFKVYSNHKILKAVLDRSVGEDGNKHLQIDIEFDRDDTDRLQWMIVQLRAFGMKDVNSEAVELEGKGLRCLGIPGKLTIGY